MIRALKIVTLSCLGLMLSLSAMAFEQTLYFTEQELQAKIHEMTPLEKQTLLANIVLTDVRLELLEQENQIAITAFLDVMALANIHGSGNVTVQGTLRYQADQGAFYLDQARLTQLNIDQLSADAVTKLKPIIQDLVMQSIQSKPIYRLQDDDMRQALIKASLKRVVVKNKQLRVTLGF